jgi:hypothetical protein
VTSPSQHPSMWHVPLLVISTHNRSVWTPLSSTRHVPSSVHEFIDFFFLSRWLILLTTGGSTEEHPITLSFL